MLVYRELNDQMTKFHEYNSNSRNYRRMGFKNH